MKYFTFSVFIEIDGIAKFMEIVATSIKSAIADMEEAFCGQVILRQWGQK